MDNHDTRAAWRYHNGTKHPNGALMSRWHVYDPEDSPLPFKIYSDLEPVPLPLDAPPRGTPALSAIADGAASGEECVPDLPALARLVHFSAGITRTIQYRWGTYQFRAAACTGALYHIEIYVVCGDLPGLEAGVYHFDVKAGALKQLRQGDFRGVLVEASGQEPFIVHAPATLVYTDVFWRNAVKYQAREYRHAFWDSGTILANTLAMAASHRLPARVVAGFVDESVVGLLDLDPEREVALALVPVGYTARASATRAPAVHPLALATVPISEDEMEEPAILAMHAASSLARPEEVAAWRGHPAPASAAPPSGQLIPLDPYAESELPQDAIETVIVRRGSTREFTREPIGFRELSTILDRATRGVPADFLGAPGATLNQAYLIVNAVEGLASGAYVFHQDRQALELLQEGDFRGEAGYLGLQQELAYDASVNIYFLADLEPVLARFGNRGYRAAQLEASIAAGRIYLAAYALRLGASGLTFFDDDVTAFFSPHARDKSVMFLVLVGTPARRGKGTT